MRERGRERGASRLFYIWARVGDRYLALLCATVSAGLAAHLVSGPGTTEGFRPDRKWNSISSNITPFSQ